MAMSRVNFTIPDDLTTKLNAHVPRRKRSAFVAAAIWERLRQTKDEALSRELREGYRVRRDEDAAINVDWEAATLETWPD